MLQVPKQVFKMARGRGRRQHTRWGPEQEEEGRSKSQKKISQLNVLGPGPPQAAQQQRMKHQRVKHAASGNTTSRLLQSQPSVRVIQALQPGKQDKHLDIRRALENERAAQAACPPAEAPQREPASAGCSGPALRHAKPCPGIVPQAKSMSASQQPPINLGSTFPCTLTAVYPQIQLSAQTHRMETELQQLAKTTAAMPSAQTGAALAAPAVTANTPVTTATGLPSILVRSSVLRQSRSKATNSPMGSDCEYLREWSLSNFLTEPSTSPSPRSKIATASKESTLEISLQPEAQQATPEVLQEWFAHTLEASRQDPTAGKYG